EPVLDVGLQVHRHWQVVHFIDALIERRGQIEVARVQLNLEVRVDLHRVGEVGQHVAALSRGARLALPRLLMLEIPGSKGTDTGFELLTITIVQLTTGVLVERRDVRRAERRGLGIVVRALCQRVELRTREAAVESASGYAFLAAQGLPELPTIDTQVSFENVV